MSLLVGPKRSKSDLRSISADNAGFVWECTGRGRGPCVASPVWGDALLVRAGVAKVQRHTAARYGGGYIGVLIIHEYSYACNRRRDSMTVVFSYGPLVARRRAALVSARLGQTHELVHAMCSVGNSAGPQMDSDTHLTRPCLDQTERKHWSRSQNRTPHRTSSAPFPRTCSKRSRSGHHREFACRYR